MDPTSDSERPTSPAYSTHILEAVGDVANPSAALRLSPDLGHIPGNGGFLESFTTFVGWMRRGSAFLEESLTRTGKVARWKMGPLTLAVVVDPEVLARIVRNEDRSWSAALAWRDYFDGIDPGSSRMYGPLFVDFDVHREARKLLQPAFSTSAIASYVEDAAPLFESTIDAWIARGTIAFKPEVRRLLARVAGKIFLGIDDEDEAARLDRDLGDLWRAPIAFTHNTWIDPNWRAATKAYRRLADRLEALVAERKHEGGRDLLSRVSAHVGDGTEAFDDAARARTCIGVLIGAFDTTSMGLSSMAYLLARNPEWQERLRSEACALGSGPVSLEDTRRLELTDRAWRETLRLYPVAPGVPRRALREVELLGHRIPAGAHVSANISNVLRDPACWTSPSTFDPDRFSPDRAEDKKHRGAYLPFGGGAHACIGMQLANAEARAFWHAMLTRCRFRLVKDYEARHTCAPIGVVSGDVRIVLERL